MSNTTPRPPRLTLIIGNKNYSSWSLRPWLAMAGAGVSFAEVIIPLDQQNSKAEILAYSPTGKVPVLKFGQLMVWESLSIIEYVNDTHPEAGIWPADVVERAHARSLACEVHAGFPWLRANCPMNLRRHAPRRLPAVVEGEVSRIVAIWRALRLKNASRGPFLFGKFTAVDAMFAPIATRLRSYRIATDPVCEEYIETIYQMPAFERWYQAALQEPWKIEDTDKVDSKVYQP